PGQGVGCGPSRDRVDQRPDDVQLHLMPLLSREPRPDDTAIVRAGLGGWLGMRRGVAYDEPFLPLRDGGLATRSSWLSPVPFWPVITAMQATRSFSFRFITITPWAYGPSLLIVASSVRMTIPLDEIIISSSSPCTTCTEATRPVLLVMFRMRC